LTLDVGAFRAVIQPELRPLATEQEQELKELVRRRRQVVEMLMAEQQRLTRDDLAEVSRRIEAHIRYLREETDTIDRRCKRECRRLQGGKPMLTSYRASLALARCCRSG